MSLCESASQSLLRSFVLFLRQWWPFLSLSLSVSVFVAVCVFCLCAYVSLHVVYSILRDFAKPENG